ncbi:MAG: MFS transporter, partial [Armatimonadia bacterium]|nr:MFS transporter [Armatimonadia bacterium]
GEGAGLWVGMPLLGALVSASFVNLNTLTQRISDARQGLANSIYRGCFSATAILAPILVTRLASVWSGYPPVLLVLAGILIASAAILFRYPGERPLGSAGGAWATCQRMWADYREAVRNRPLMRMIHVTQVWFACVAAVFTFAAIRFTQDLGVTDERFGEFSAAAGVMTMLGVLSTGLFLDKVSIRRFSTLCAIIAAACCLTMGLTDSVAVSAVAFIVFGPMHMMIAGPVSMWVSRAAGESSQTSAFTVHKVVTAAYMAVGVASLGFLESWLGMRMVFLISGIVAILTGAGFQFLSEPPPPRLREDDS